MSKRSRAATKSPTSSSRAQGRHKGITNPTLPFCVGVVGVVLCVALRHSAFTSVQAFWVVRATLSVAVAAIAVAALNGMINATFKSKSSAGAWTVRATGGFAVFVLLYVYTPLVDAKQSALTTPSAATSTSTAPQSSTTPSLLPAEPSQNAASASLPGDAIAPAASAPVREAAVMAAQGAIPAATPPRAHSPSARPSASRARVVGMSVKGDSQGGAAVAITNSGGADSVGLDVSANANAGQSVTGLYIEQKGPGVGLLVNQTGPGVGVRVTAGSGPRGP